jgi:predicted DNA-binding transcriptional regulator YafY
MLRTSARLLQLLSLFQIRRNWSGAELSARLEVTSRTLRRDVDRLRSLGYPVHSATGAAGGYQLGAGSTIPPLLLTDEEAVAVAIGLKTAANGAISGIEEASLGALLKLEQVMPSRLRSRVAALHSFIVPIGNTEPAVDAKMLSSIAAACRDHQGLRFGYSDRAGSSTSRSVEPTGLVHTGRRWYLVAWDLARQDWRTFRVDRIVPKLLPGPRFAPRKPPAKDLATYVAKSVSYEPYPYRATVAFLAPLREVASRVPPSAGQVEAIDHGSCRLRLGSNSLDMLAFYIVLIGVEFRIEEPAELRDHMRTLATRLHAAASDNL